MVPVETAVREIAPQRVGWGGVVAGALLSIGIWILLEVLGLAVGLSALDPRQQSFKGIGIGAGVWTLLAPLLALFLGGIIAGRLSGYAGRPGGALHGAVMWALTLFLGVLMVGSLGRALLTGAAGAAGTALSEVSAGGPSSLDVVGIDPAGLAGPVNARLREAGKPEVSAGQIEAAANAALGKAAHGGRLDRESFAAEFSARTGLGHGDARQLGDIIDHRWSAATGQLRFQALSAADRTGKALFWVFGALLLGLVSSVLGAVVGVARREAPVAVPAPAGAVVPPPQQVA